jgi:uncharacterized protein YndB with AHSA1/START domain
MKMDKATVTLPSDREVQVVRSFNAPRATVYRAFTEPALVRRWMLGPPGWTMPICEMDVRVDGRYRWVWRSETDSSEFGFSGTYLEVEPDSRLVHTERFVPGTIGAEYPEGAARVTTSFAETGGITTVTALIDFGSKEARDAAVATGMTDGMEQSYALLDRHLADTATVPASGG